MCGVNSGASCRVVRCVAATPCRGQCTCCIRLNIGIDWLHGGCSELSTCMRFRLNGSSTFVRPGCSMVRAPRLSCPFHPFLFLLPFDSPATRLTVCATGWASQMGVVSKCGCKTAEQHGSPATPWRGLRQSGAKLTRCRGSMHRMYDVHTPCRKVSTTHATQFPRHATHMYAQCCVMNSNVLQQAQGTPRFSSFC